MLLRLVSADNSLGLHDGRPACAWDMLLSPDSGCPSHAQVFLLAGAPATVHQHGCR